MNPTPAVTLAEVESLPLARTTCAEYCRAIQRAKQNEFWWYFTGLVRRRNVWKPFQDAEDRWWWYVKPWFAWPVDFFTPIATPDKVRPRFKLLGWQFPVVESEADSHVHLNVIRDLAGYDLDRIENKKRRHTIRKALREHQYAVADPADTNLTAEACEVWNSHVHRTGWNTPMSVDTFQASWSELATCPGTTVLTARERGGSGALCAWLIGRVIDETAFVDTLTSHTDRLFDSPNDGLVFLYLLSAARMGVAHAHYALKSSIQTLESFKQALGFVPHPFPARLCIRRPVGTALRLLWPQIYRRLRRDSPSSTKERSSFASPNGER